MTRGLNSDDMAWHTSAGRVKREQRSAATRSSSASRADVDQVVSNARRSASTVDRVGSGSCAALIYLGTESARCDGNAARCRAQRARAQRFWQFARAVGASRRKTDTLQHGRSAKNGRKSAGRARHVRVATSSLWPRGASGQQLTSRIVQSGCPKRRTRARASGSHFRHCTFRLAAVAVRERTPASLKRGRADARATPSARLRPSSALCRSLRPASASRDGGGRFGERCTRGDRCEGGCDREGLSPSA